MYRQFYKCQRNIDYCTAFAYAFSNKKGNTLTTTSQKAARFSKVAENTSKKQKVSKLSQPPLKTDVLESNAAVKTGMLETDSYDAFRPKQRLRTADLSKKDIASFLKSLDIRQSSKNTYERQLIEFFGWCTEKKHTQLNREHILSYKEYLKNDRELAAFTIGGYLTAVRRFFEWLEATEQHSNIARGIKGPARKRGFKKDALTVDQAKLILGSIKRTTLSGKRDYAMINLMLRTGLRTIEIARALREDICKQGGETVLYIHGKGRDSKDELVLLTAYTLEPLEEYFKARGLVKNEDPLFASHSTKNFGKKMTTRSVSRIVKIVFRKVNMDDSRLTAHSLRHTAITLSLLAGATPQEARAMARHSDINTTLIYAHNINRIKQAPEKKIDEILE